MPVLLDLATGRMVKSDLEGEMAMSMERKAQGQDGRAVTMTVSGKGKAVVHSWSKPAGGAAEERPVVNEKEPPAPDVH